MKAFIYVGGKIDVNFITEHPKGEDITVAADSGIRNALSLGDRVDIAVGDFDSFPEREIPEGAEIIRLKPEKDITDAQAAIEIAIERGADSFVIIGGLSGRLDHTLANLSILEDLTARNHYAIMTDGTSRVHFINGGSALIGRSGFKYFSPIPATPGILSDLSPIKAFCSMICKGSMPSSSLKFSLESSKISLTPFLV
jgi:thiamine pyrophosphokinase